MTATPPFASVTGPARPPARPTAGLYVHCPFCRGKCAYCDFYSLASPERLPQWLESLELEMDLQRAGWPGPFDTLYLGGGTPSIMSTRQLVALVERLFKTFNFTSNPEVTLEANPEDITSAALKGYRQAGLTRLSLGVQSFEPSALAFLGRRHEAERAYKAADLICRAGFALNLDLIYARPGQSQKAWQAELNQALSLNPQHLSLYGLTVEPGTPLAVRLKKGTAPKLPDETEFAELFLFTGEYLAGRGYQRYEVSNFAAGGANQSRHNLKYWRHQPYLGLGPAAHSFKTPWRRANPRSLNRWLASLKGSPTAFLVETETLTPEALKMERIMLGLRLAEGLAEDFFEPSARLNSLLEHGYLRREQGCLKPTEKGLLAADRLSLELA